MNNMIGTMQGRLLPKYKNRYQAHPIGYWQDEFPIAKKMGMDCIEFILDFNDSDSNPLLNHAGIDEILLVSERTGVTVASICADYLMEAPLHSKDDSVAEQSVTVLTQLIDSAISLGATDIVIPCVDQSTLSGRHSQDRLATRLYSLLNLAEKANVNLSLETDLAPEPFATLLERFDSKRLTANYDIGNSAALGYDPVEELEAYGGRISDIHIKDRVRNGGPVRLGDGSADFDLFFSKLTSMNYTGPFIMQAYRDNEGVTIFKEQLHWIMPYLEGLENAS